VKRRRDSRHHGWITETPDIAADDKRQLIDTLYFRMIELARAGTAL
jgi:hypothetical protein